MSATGGDSRTRLAVERRRAEGPTDVFRLDEPGARVDCADRAHRQHGRREAGAAARGTNDRSSVPRAGYQCPYKATESRRRERLVDGRVVGDPRVPSRDCPRVLREASREVRIEQGRRARTAAVMHEADDRAACRERRSRPSRIDPVPGPVGTAQTVRRNALPQHRVAQRAEAAEAAKRVQSATRRDVRPAHLIEEGLADAVDGAFHTAPELEMFACGHAGSATACGRRR